MNKTAISGLFLSAVLSAVSVDACDMHGTGFGMYAKPGTHLYSASSSPAYDPVKILLRHPYFTNLPNGKEKTVEIQYTVPAQITDAVLTVSSTTGIDLKSDSNVELSEKTGTVPVTFGSETPGRHQLVVKVSGVNGEKPVNQTRHISVMVK